MKKKLLFIGLISLLACGLNSFAQFSISTNYTSGSFINPPANGVGGNAAITFQVENTNSYPVMLDTLQVYVTTAYNNSVYELWYTSTQLNGTANINTTNGWNQIGTTSSPIPVSSNGYYNVLTNIGFIIPPATIYRFALRSSLGIIYAGTNAPNQASPNIFTSNGVELHTSDATNGGVGAVGYGGAFPTPTNQPRAFDGTLDFIPALPCAGPPTAGIVSPSGPLSSCLGKIIPLTVTGYTLAQNITYQWWESVNAGAWTAIAGATATTYNATPIQPTEYRMVVTCTNTNDTAITNTVSITPTLPSYATIPYFQDFEIWDDYCDIDDVPNDGYWSNSPAESDSSWRRQNQGITAGWASTNTGFYSPQAVSGTGSARFHSAQVDSGYSGKLDLYLDCSDLSMVGRPKALYFYYHNNVTSGNAWDDSLLVEASYNGPFINLLALDTAKFWKRGTVDLNTSSPQVILRFRGASHSDNGNTDIGIDSVYIAGPCDNATAPTPGSITGVPASLCPGSSYNLTTLGTTMAGGLTYQWQQSVDGTMWTPAVGTGANSLFFTTPKLYDTIMYRLQVGCGFNTATTASVTLEITSPVYATLPYTQNFESWANKCAIQDIPDSSWVNIPMSGNTSWRRQNQGSVGGWSNPNGGAYMPAFVSGSNSARFHSSVADSGSTGELLLAVDCSQQAGNKELWFHRINPDGDDTLFIDLSTDGGFSFTNITKYTDTSNWAEERVSFSSASATTLIRFRGYADGKLDDMGIDSVRVVEPCASVNAGTINNLPIVCPNVSTLLYLIGNSQTAGLTYDWQSSADGITWSSIAGATSYTYSSFITAPTYYRVVVTCAGAAVSDTTPVQFIDIKPFYDCYCPSAATTISGADIGNVTLHSMSQPQLFSNGNATPANFNITATNTYTNFMNTVTPVEMYMDTSYTIEIAQINSGGFNAATVAAWIDFNMNGIFDGNEQIILQSTSATSTPPQVVSGTFSVPLGLDTGLTGMRVIINQGGVLDPCGSYTTGETEDYFVRIIYPPCDGPMTAGIIEAYDTTACPNRPVVMYNYGYQTGVSGFKDAWQQSPDSIAWMDIPGTEGMDTLTHTPTTTTYYRKQFICQNPLKLDTTNTNVIRVGINPPVSCYCLSRSVGTNEDSSDIGGFYFESFTNNVGGPHIKNPLAYRRSTDFTRQTPPDLWIDSTYDFTLYHIMRSETGSSAKVTMFIDYNRDLVYDIPQEHVFTGFTSSANNYVLQGSITIPNNALPDIPTGMRVIINNDTGPNSPSDDGCGIYTSGETEDYVVVIRSPLTTNIHRIAKIQHLNIYPNPNEGKFMVSFNSVQEVKEVRIKVLSVTGAMVLERSFENTGRSFQGHIDLSHTAKGVYMVEVITDEERNVRRVIVQ